MANDDNVRSDII